MEYDHEYTINPNNSFVDTNKWPVRTNSEGHKKITVTMESPISHVQTIFIFCALVLHYLLQKQMRHPLSIFEIRKECNMKAKL